MTQLGQRLGLDLANALARHAKLASNLLERTGMTVLKAKAQLDNLALALRKSIENLRELLLQHREAGGVRGDDSLRVLDEVAQLRVLLLADGCLEGHRLLGDLLDLAHAVGAHIHLGADLLRGRVAAEVLKQLALHAHELVDGLDHVDRDTDGTGLVGDCAGNA